MKEPTKERSHLPVPSVTRPLIGKKIISRGTKRPTKEISHLSVPSVTRPLKNELKGHERTH